MYLFVDVGLNGAHLSVLERVFPACQLTHGDVVAEAEDACAVSILNALLSPMSKGMNVRTTYDGTFSLTKHTWEGSS